MKVLTELQRDILKELQELILMAQTLAFQRLEAAGSSEHVFAF